MKLVLFCDYGLDDAVATVDALIHSQEDGYKEVVLVAIGGSVPPTLSLRNAIRLISNCDFSFSPVTIVDTTMREQPFEFLSELHGGDGMGNLFQDKPFHAKVLPFDAWLNDFSGEYRLLSLGPMTLVRELLQKYVPETFVFMGGNLAGAPNFHGCEFNHALDRDAFQEAVKYPHVALTLDSCCNPFFKIGQERLKGDILSKILSRAREHSPVSGECCIRSVMAVKYLRHPNWFTVRYAEDQEGNELNYAQYVHGENYLKLLPL